MKHAPHTRLSHNDHNFRVWLCPWDDIGRYIMRVTIHISSSPMVFVSVVFLLLSIKVIKNKRAQQTAVKLLVFSYKFSVYPTACISLSSKTFKFGVFWQNKQSDVKQYVTSWSSVWETVMSHLIRLDHRWWWCRKKSTVTSKYLRTAAVWTYTFAIPTMPPTATVCQCENIFA